MKEENIFLMLKFLRRLATTPVAKKPKPYAALTPPSPATRAYVTMATTVVLQLLVAPSAWTLPR